MQTHDARWQELDHFPEFISRRNTKTYHKLLRGVFRNTLLWIELHNFDNFSIHRDAHGRERLREHSELTTAVVHDPSVSPLDSVDHLKPNAQCCARMFQRDLELLRVSRARRLFFEVWHGDWKEMFEAVETATEFCLIDPRLLRVASRTDFLPTDVADLKRASVDTGRSSVCQPTK